MRLSSFILVKEILDKYTNLRRNNISREDSVRELADHYHNEIQTGTEDDCWLFWVGVADAQYRHRELTRDVADMGIMALNHLSNVAPEIAAIDIKKRREHYDCAPMAAKKSFRKAVRYRCKWGIGDTFAYQLNGDEAKQAGLDGTFVMIRKVDEIEETDGRLLPIVTFTHWGERSLPLCEEDFNKKPPLKLASGRLGSSRSTYEYRIEILLSHQKQVDQLKLLYIGNFPNISLPINEFYRKEPGYMLMLSTDKFNKMLCHYCEVQSYYS